MLYIMKIVCPTLTLLYAVKQTFNGDDAFILPFKAWLHIDAGQELCYKGQVEGLIIQDLLMIIVPL